MFTCVRACVRACHRILNNPSYISGIYPPISNHRRGNYIKEKIPIPYKENHKHSKLDRNAFPGRQRLSCRARVFLAFIPGTYLRIISTLFWFRREKREKKCMEVKIFIKIWLLKTRLSSCLTCFQKYIFPMNEHAVASFYFYSFFVS